MTKRKTRDKFLRSGRKGKEGRRRSGGVKKPGEKDYDDDDGFCRKLNDRLKVWRNFHDGDLSVVFP